MGLFFTIMLINVVYVSFFTLRMILVLKGKKLLASFLSMAEIFVYLMGLTIVLNNLDKPWNIFAYCVGWGSGVYLGSKIEEWLALGYVTVQIVIDSKDTRLAPMLREKGYGVTSWFADGKDGARLVMQVLAKRSNEKKLMNWLQTEVPKAFIISYEPKTFYGGFWTKRITS